MTSPPVNPGEKRYNRHYYGLRCTRILSGRSGVSREALFDRGPLEIPGRRQTVLRPGRINPENILLPARDPAEKKPGATGVQRPGKFFAVTGTRRKIFRLVPVPAGKNPERLHPDARDIFRLPGIILRTAHPGVPPTTPRAGTMVSCSPRAG